jgi:hypothetical protein
LIQPLSVGSNHPVRLDVSLQGHRSLLRQGLQHADHAMYGWRQGYVLQLKMHAAGFHLLQVQHLVDQAAQVPTGLQNLIDVLTDGRHLARLDWRLQLEQLGVISVLVQRLPTSGGY